MGCGQERRECPAGANVYARSSRVATHKSLPCRPIGRPRGFGPWNLGSTPNGATQESLWLLDRLLFETHKARSSATSIRRTARGVPTSTCAVHVTCRPSGCGRLARARSGGRTRRESGEAKRNGGRPDRGSSILPGFVLHVRAHVRIQSRARSVRARQRHERARVRHVYREGEPRAH